MPTASLAPRLIDAASALAKAVDRLGPFGHPVAHVYNPLNYAWAPHEAYLAAYGRTRKRVVFLGMNPGPFGMAQTGVPFGEIAAVRDWLRIEAPVRKPKNEHPKRPVTGFACPRREISGQRLWGLFAQRFKSPASFFQDHFVVNYCPLVFMKASCENITPDKLARPQRDELEAVCDAHLRKVIDALQPKWLIGVGVWAEKRAREALPGSKVTFGKIAHPSPASPAANRDWAGLVTKQLQDLQVW